MGKFNRLLAEKQELLQYMENIQREYNIVTDQYMEGTTGEESIGKYQNKLMRMYNKHKRRVEAIDTYLYRVRSKNNIPL